MKTEFSLAQLADPDIKEADKILRACVHCGFCTATCPTYVLLGDELDSPRGRIYLIKQMLEKDEKPTAEVVKHIDRCLSCLACMTTCPSGVNYMHLVDQARVRIERDYKRPLVERGLRALLAFVLPRPDLFRWSMRLAQLEWRWHALAMLDPSSRWPASRRFSSRGLPLGIDFSGGTVVTISSRSRRRGRGPRRARSALERRGRPDAWRPGPERDHGAAAAAARAGRARASTRIRSAIEAGAARGEARAVHGRQQRTSSARPMGADLQQEGHLGDAHGARRHPRLRRVPLPVLVRASARSWRRSTTS